MLDNEDSSSGPYSGDGVNKTFTYDYRVDDADHLEVILVQPQADGSKLYPVLRVGVDYSVTGVGNPSGGSIEFPIQGSTYPVLPAGSFLFILRDPPFTQETNLSTLGAYRPNIIENMVDEVVKQTQRLLLCCERAYLAPIGQVPGKPIDELINDLMSLVILRDGSQDMDSGYVPTKPRDVVTAEFLSAHLPHPGPHESNTVDTIAALRGVDVAIYKTRMWVRGYMAIDDDMGGVYDWDLTSTKDDDDKDIILPTGHVGAGRWRRSHFGVATYEGMEVYVNPTGIDAPERGGVHAPFRTLQYAYDSLPLIINHMVTIRLSAGVHRENYLTPTFARDNFSYPRAAFLFAKGKQIAPRSQRVPTHDNTREMVAGIVISGEGTEVTTLACGADFDYGIYNTEGQLAVEDLTITNDIAGSPGNTMAALLVSHRGNSYVHADNINLLGEDRALTAYGAYCESGGHLEFVGSGNIKECGTGVTTLTSGDSISLAGDIYIFDCINGATVTSNSNLFINNTWGVKRGMKIYSCSAFAILADSGAIVKLRGFDDDFRTDVSRSVEISSPINLYLNATLEAIYTRINAPVTIQGSVIKLNTSDFQHQIKASGSFLELVSSNSYINPATSNTNPTCILLDDSSGLSVDVTSNLVSSEGVSYGPRNQAMTANGSHVDMYSGSRVYNISGTNSQLTGCFLNSIWSDNSQEIEKGVSVDLYGFSWGVQMDSSHARMGTFASFSIGNSPGQYTGARFTYDGHKWQLVSLGQLVA